MRITFILLFIITISFSLQAEQLERRQGELIVKLKASHSIEGFIKKFNTSYRVNIDLQIKTTISKNHDIYLLTFDESQYRADQMLDDIRAQSSVVYAQFNHLYETRSTKPNDAHYNRQWDMNRIAAPEVWNLTSGGTTMNGDTIVVAVLDGSFDDEHEDLLPNLWHNKAEIPNDGIDNDGNGYVDDCTGWNFKHSTDDHRMLSGTGLNHGTGVAGIIGAKGNNGIGVTGVSWNVKLMLLSVVGTDSQIASAYFYALDQRKLYNQTNGQKGALVVATSISMGRSYATSEQFPLWCEMFDLMGEQGILSAAATANEGYDVDIFGDIPTSCSSDYLLTVTNTNDTDTRELNAAWGRESIDLSAPGSTCFTTRGNNEYGNFNGTSAATPHVAGAVALLYSMPCQKLADEAMTQPAQTALRVKDFILNGVDILRDLETSTVSGGRLNINNSLKEMRYYCGGTTGDLKVQIFPNPVNHNEDISITYETPDFEYYTIKIYNTLGQLIKSKTILPPDFADKQTTISTQDLSAGIYFLSIHSTTDKTVFTDRFVVR